MREAQAKLRRLEEERAAVLKQRDRLREEHGGDAAMKNAAEELAAAEAQLAAREAEAQAAETALNTARETERRARSPYEATERNLGALQAEARTLAELLDLEKTKRFPPLLDSLEVSPGYEPALVAALGDDLDASLDPGAPAFWGASGSDEFDRAAARGRRSAQRYRQRPGESRRGGCARSGWSKPVQPRSFSQNSRPASGW